MQRRRSVTLSMAATLENTENVVMFERRWLFCKKNKTSLDYWSVLLSEKKKLRQFLSLFPPTIHRCVGEEHTLLPLRALVFHASHTEFTDMSGKHRNEKHCVMRRLCCYLMCRKGEVGERGRDCVCVCVWGGSGTPHSEKERRGQKGKYCTRVRMRLIRFYWYQHRYWSFLLAQFYINSHNNSGLIWLHSHTWLSFTHTT